MVLVTRRGGGFDGEAGCNEDAEDKVAVDFFFRFFLPSPLPMNNTIVCSCIFIYRCRVVIVGIGGAKESNTVRLAANKIAMRTKLIGLVCIILVRS